MIDVKLMETLLEALENCTLDRHGRETWLGHGPQLSNKMEPRAVRLRL
jgi:hypothetical protein